jgi:hypothetical protein
MLTGFLGGPLPLRHWVRRFSWSNQHMFSAGDSGFLLVKAKVFSKDKFL